MDIGQRIWFEISGQVEESKFSIYFVLVVSSRSCFAANVACALLRLVVLHRCLLLVGLLTSCRVTH